MEFNTRTVLVIAGILVMVVILLDGFRRMYKNRREALKLDVKGDLKFSSDSSFSGELPNGGARLLGDEEEDDNVLYENFSANADENNEQNYDTPVDATLSQDEQDQAEDYQLADATQSAPEQEQQVQHEQETAEPAFDQQAQAGQHVADDQAAEELIAQQTIEVPALNSVDAHQAASSRQTPAKLGTEYLADVQMAELSSTLAVEPTPLDSSLTQADSTSFENTRVERESVNVPAENTKQKKTKTKKKHQLPDDYQPLLASEDDKFDHLGNKKTKYQEEFVDLEISPVRVRSQQVEPEENAASLENAAPDKLENESRISAQPVDLDQQVPVLMDVEELGDDVESQKSQASSQHNQNEQSDGEEIVLTSEQSESINNSLADFKMMQTDDGSSLSGNVSALQQSEQQASLHLPEADATNGTQGVADLIAEIKQQQGEGDNLQVDAQEMAENIDGVIDEVEYVKAPVRFANKDAETLAEREDAKLVLVLHVLAQSDEGFLGEDLVYLINNCDLRFAENNIFHRFEQSEGQGSIQFSMANVENPGSFNLETMMNDRYKGISLFMSLPGAGKALNAFEAMSEMALLIARNLEGEVLDESRSAVTTQTIDYNRQQIRDFVRKQKISDLKRR